MADCCALPSSAAAPPVMACPACGGRSKKVDAITVKSLVRRLPFGMAPAQYYFCAAPACGVVYFPSNPNAPTFYLADLWVRVGRKAEGDPIPVCYCFGVERRDIADEVQRTGRSAIAERIKAEVKAGNCACEVKNPSGKCCLGDVTRAVLDALQTAEVGGSRSR
jgi:CopZ-like zinc binding protein